jgi:hypothetical protein
MAAGVLLSGVMLSQIIPGKALISVAGAAAASYFTLRRKARVMPWP